LEINYKIQIQPDGIASALILGEDFLENSPSALILGDNLFHGENLINNLKIANQNLDSSTVFAYAVSDPERYGVVNFDSNGKALSIEEKPKKPKSRYAITGLYFFDKNGPKNAKTLRPSNRGELEITDLTNLYLKEEKLKVAIIGRGTTWLDTGTYDSLHQASSYIRTLEKRQGHKVCAPEEIAWRMGFINNSRFKKLAKSLKESGYGQYLLGLLKEKYFFNEIDIN